MGLSITKLHYSLLLLFSFYVASAQDILMQDGTFTQCSGTFYDSGGAGGNYTAGENLTITICPDMPDMRVVLEFLTFELIPPDEITIYDSNVVDASALIGTFTGDLTDTANSILSNISASDPNLSGCLTLVFSSNTFFETSGWEATISCRPPCQLIEASIDNITPSTFDGTTYTVNLSEILTFDASAIFGDGFDAGATYTWDFGDGSAPVTGQSVTHFYTLLGTYFVTLTVEDANGCTNFNIINQEVEVIFDSNNPGPGCPNINGEDVLFDCEIPDQVTLTSDFLVTGETTSYRVDPIPYAPPFPYTGLSNPISVNQDDVWSNLINLPFDFCFFGNVETSIRVGSNGIISFQNPSGTNNFTLNNGNALPGNGNALIDANIMVNHDIDPSILGTNPDIAWEIIGQSPCRTFVVSFSSVAHFGCNNLTSTFMMVLYETTNAIEIYIENKDVCNNWQNGLAVMGIQNNSATQAFVPPGRNIGTWAANQEAWRFTPDGNPNVTFSWFDPSGNFISNAPDITVPVIGDETYTVEAVYVNCNGDQVVVEDDAVIDVNPAFDLTLTSSADAICDGQSVTLDAVTIILPDSNINENDLVYEWLLDGNPLSDNTTTITVDDPGTYTVIVTGGPCTKSLDLVIDSIDIPEITIPPIDLSQCGDFSLSQTFDLTVNNAVSMGIALPADAVITYHNTQADADTNVNAITDPANYLPANTSETIFIRLESIDSADCFSTDSFEIDIFDVEITTPADINICTPTANTGITTFDLSLQNNIVFGPNQDPTTHSLSYHTSLADANAGANPIPNPATFSNTTNPETIWVRVQNIDNPNCFEVTSFEISVTEEPVITLTPNLSLCGDFSLTQAFDLTQNDAVALGILNAADVVLAYFNSQTDADTPVNAIANPTAYIPGSATETIWVRAENVNDPSCYTTASFQIDIFDVEAIQPPDLSLCAQTGGTGQTLWDLTQQDAIVLGPNQDVTTHNTSYHNSNADATANTNAIPDPANYTNTATPEEIWVRVENATDPSCFAITSFNLIVVEEPEVTIPAVDLSQCGDFTGTQAFDLTVNNAVSLGVPGAGSTILTYHTSQTDADANTNAITDPANYIPTAATQTIYIRLENTGDSTCFGTTSFLLNIFDVEAIQPPDLSLCAQTGGTGQTLWDLTQQDAVVLGPNQDVTTHNTSYHNSNADATANTNAIPDPANYTNTATPEEIWVRVENATDPSCFAIISFNLIVVEQPEVTIPAVDLSQCGDFSLTQIFDLTVNNAVSLGVPDAAGTVLSYHTSLADADTNANAITDPANYIPTAATQTIYIRLENAGDGTCFITTSFNITIFDVEAIQPPDLSLCAQTGGTGQTLWDLTQQDAVVLGPNQDVTTHNTSYHNSNADATANTNAIPDPANYTNTATPEEIWVRVENATDPSCFAITSFNLIVVEQPEVTIPAVDLSQCGDFTGTQPFDLTLNDLTSLGVPDAAGTILTYHNDPTDANTGSNPIANPTLYLASSNPETIYIRLENAGDNSCFITESFVVGSFDVEAIAPSDIESCDDGSGNGTAAFDLTSISAEALGSNQTLATHNISFHLSLTDADANVNPIPNPSSYVNLTSPQDIFIRIENQLNPNCYAVTSFQIIVSNSDPINLNIDPLVACDDDNDGFFNNFDLTTLDDIITIGNTDIVISYHLTLADAINNVGVLASPYSNVVQDQQEIFIRALDTNNGCEQFGSFFIQVVPSPLLTPIQDPLVGCDDDFDGVLTFDLTEVEAEALGTLDPANLIITYHTSLLGAQTDTDLVPIPTAFQNTSSPQSIWIKVVDTSNNSLCFDIQEFQIIVEALPTITNPEPLEVCDDDTGGDLSDEIATFDLNDAIDEITLGNNELNVQFFETEDDLLNNNPINPIDAYVNTTNPQTLEILVTASTNGCSIRTTITLAVNPVPSLAPVLDPIEICDPDNDGFAEFDLQDIIEDILNNEPEVSITFHLTAADAELGVNPIDTSLPFGTSNNDTQTIYVRATNTGPNGNDGTECFDTRPLDLIVVPSPEIENLIDLSRCDDDTPNGFASFDLTINTPEAIGTQNDTQVTYHETQADAEAGTNAIAVPTNYTNITNPQTIYVRIEDLVTGCVDLFDSIGDPNNTFTLTVEALPVVFTPTALEICDDDYNQDPFPQTVFDLTVKEPEIVGQTVVPANLVFTYFESQDDLDNGVAITDPTAYTNAAQPQTIFITVQDTNTQNSCTTTVLLTINVLPLPSPSTTDPDVLRLTGCDDDNDGVAIDPFDLTFSGNFIAGSENVLLSYYLNEDGAINEDPADLIADPTAYINDPALNETDQNGLPTNVQIIYVRVDNNVAGNFCFVIVPFELVVLPNPELNPEGDPFAYTLCADDETSPENATLFSTQDITNNLWDLTDGASNIIIPLLDPNTTPVQNIEDFVVTYHTSEQDAEDGINAISPGYIASNGEILFIRVTNIDSQCFNTNNIAQVQIIIEPRPNIAADNPDELVVCADDFQQGIATIDLTLYDDLINPGAPNNTQVVYYEGQTNYDNGVFITDPVNYTTIQTPTTIIAEVINTLTGCESSRTLVFDIIVNPIFGDISGFDGVILCVDALGNAIFNEISPPVIDTELSEAEFSFEWALDGVPLPDTTPSITPTLPGLYTVVVTHLLTGCQANSSANVIPNQAINFNVDVVTTAFSSTHAAEVNTITGNGDFEFRIDDGPWIQLQPGQTTLLFTNLTPGMHTITGRDQGGCGEVSIEFMFIDYPPFFTPNQDGFNDTWNISTLSGDEQATVYIFDRYGKLLKQISPRGEGWDGTYNGKAMPSQDYWFRVEFIEPTTGAKSEFKAHFTLKR